VSFLGPKTSKFVSVFEPFAQARRAKEDADEDECKKLVTTLSRIKKQGAKSVASKIETEDAWVLLDILNYAMWIDPDNGSSYVNVHTAVIDKHGTGCAVAALANRKSLVKQFGLWEPTM